MINMVVPACALHSPEWQSRLRLWAMHSAPIPSTQSVFLHIHTLTLQENSTMFQLFYMSDKLKSSCLCSHLSNQQVYFEKLDFSLLATKSLFPKHFSKDNSNSKKSRERLSSPTIIAEDQTKRGEDKEVQNIKNKVSTSRKKTES